MDYGKILNLPETEFPMRAGLPQHKNYFLNFWEEAFFYGKKQALHAGHKKFVLHDGPPYANGKIHMGHALNKILKDIIMKYKYARGFDTPYVPGWDTHGMPIEHAAIKELGLNRNELDPLTLRRKCHLLIPRTVTLAGCTSTEKLNAATCCISIPSQRKIIF